MRQSGLSGAVVDDNEYWRSTLGSWFGDVGVKIAAYADYAGFRKSVDLGSRYDFVLGDKRMKLSRRDGQYELYEIAATRSGSLGCVFIYTVADRETVEMDTLRIRESSSCDMMFHYLSKDTDRVHVIDRVLEAVRIA